MARWSLVVVAVVFEASVPADPAGPAPECRGSGFAPPTHPALQQAWNAWPPRACVSLQPATPIPSSVSTAIEPDPVTLRAGSAGSAAIALTNTGRTSVELFLDNTGRHTIEASYELRDAAGKRVDLAGTACPTFAPLPRAESLHLGIPAGQTLRIPIAVDAIARRIQNCNAVAAGNVSPGRYTLVVHAAFGDVTGTVVIERP